MISTKVSEMVSTLASLAQHSLAGLVLKDNLVPHNNNASFLGTAAAYTVTICGEESDEPIAYGALHVYSSKQAYIILGEVAEKYREHTLWLEETESTKKSKTFKVAKSVPHAISNNAATLFEAVFADHSGKSAHLHLVDQLIGSSLGIDDMDVMKNFTVDVLHSENEDALSSLKRWRDVSGFVVSDKFKFEQVKLNRFELLALDDENSKIETSSITKSNVMLAQDYDADLTMYDRTDFLNALLQTDGVFGRVATLDGQVCGYGLARSDRVLQCYGDNEETMRKLLADLAGDMSEGQVSMFVRHYTNSTMDNLMKLSTQRNKVTRLHTRTTSLGFKPSLVACHNMGLHMF